MRHRIAVLFSGTGTNLAYLAEHAPRYGIEIAVAISNRPDAGGIAVAERFGIPVVVLASDQYTQREAFDRDLVQTLASWQVDLVVLAGFMRILTPVFTDTVRAINLHPSLLPRHKGLHAIRRSWEDGEPEGGVSVHWVTSELDGGAIILQKRLAKKGLDFATYDRTIRRIEKEALMEALCLVLDSKPCAEL
jgi:phosphoribosylglycinamide formyltransferase-1